MADAAGISVRALEHWCRSALGRTPYQLLTETRLHRADQLLAVGRTPAEAADAVGFTRLDRFRTAYRDRYGTEPLPGQGRPGKKAEGAEPAIACLQHVTGGVGRHLATIFCDRALLASAVPPGPGE
jgi:AraC-like DNA-binding protein